MMQDHVRDSIQVLGRLPPKYRNEEWHQLARITRAVCEMLNWDFDLLLKRSVEGID